MKLICAPTVIFVIPILIAAVSSLPVTPTVDPALVPEFGVEAGVNPTGTGDCDGIRNASGAIVKIPCACPPDRSQFIRSLTKNVQAGVATNNPSIAVSFPSDESKQSQITRIQAALITLQNLNGPGQGCPAASTTFVSQLQQAMGLDTNTSAPPASSTPKPPDNSQTVDPAFVPDLGHESGLNPTGTGDCDGAVENAAGQVVKIPCSCPPDRQTFIDALSKDIAAGHAVNNPSVAVTFPTDNSNESKAQRIQASLVTLQNLNGPGKGCPAASTTLLAQLKALQS